jgi:hypothetical protein
LIDARRALRRRGFQGVPGRLGPVGTPAARGGRADRREGLPGAFQRHRGTLPDRGRRVPGGVVQITLVRVRRGTARRRRVQRVLQRAGAVQGDRGAGRLGARPGNPGIVTARHGNPVFEAAGVVLARRGVPRVRPSRVCPSRVGGSRVGGSQVGGSRVGPLRVGALRGEVVEQIGVAGSAVRPARRRQVLRRAVGLRRAHVRSADVTRTHVTRFRIARRGERAGRGPERSYLGGGVLRRERPQVTGRAVHPEPRPGERPDLLRRPPPGRDVVIVVVEGAGRGPGAVGRGPPVEQGPITRIGTGAAVCGPGVAGMPCFVHRALLACPR